MPWPADVNAELLYSAGIVKLLLSYIQGLLRAAASCGRLTCLLRAHAGDVTIECSCGPLQAVLRPVAQPPGGRHVLFEHFWVEMGDQSLPEATATPHFVMTPSVRGHLRNLARAALVRRFPILLQVRGACWPCSLQRQSSSLRGAGQCCLSLIPGWLQHLGVWVSLVWIICQKACLPPRYPPWVPPSTQTAQLLLDDTLSV